jgi:hypothetical protein
LIDGFFGDAFGEVTCFGRWGFGKGWEFGVWVWCFRKMLGWVGVMTAVDMQFHDY